MCCSTLNMLQTKKHSRSPFFGTVSLPSNDLCKYYFGLHFTLMFKKKTEAKELYEMHITAAQSRRCCRRLVPVLGGESSYTTRPVKFHI